MTDVKTAIVLAAGASRRMGAMTQDTPKSLLAYKGKPILERLVGQLERAGMDHIVVVAGYHRERVHALLDGRRGVDVVDNELYDRDVNIHSMRLALRRVSGSVSIFEADTIAEDAMVGYATGSDFEGQSVWFTRGPFLPDQYGGIVKSDELGRIVDVRVVPRFSDEYRGHSKMTGFMRVAGKELPLFRQLVEQYADRTLEQYFFVPWAENLTRLPSVEGDARHYVFGTFNTPAEYAAVAATDYDPPPPSDARIELVDPRRLKHIEGHDEDRVTELAAKIEREGVWTKPLYIEKHHDLVLDGQHRLEVALRLGLQRVPVQGFDYRDVSVWTLRKEEPVDIATVIARADAGRAYPYKTVKHKFPNVIGNCHIPLAELR